MSLMVPSASDPKQPYISDQIIKSKEAVSLEFRENSGRDVIQIGCQCGLSAWDIEVGPNRSADDLTWLEKGGD